MRLSNRIPRLAALAAPFATSLGFTVVLAWVLMLAGLTHVFSSWHAETLLAVARRIGVGLLYLCVGVVIQRNPLWGVAGLTMVVGAVVFADGVIGLATYFSEEDPATSIYDFATDDYMTHWMSVRYLTDKWQVTGGLRNIFDEEPETISQGFYFRNGNAPLYSGYDYFGRQAFVQLAIKF